MTPELPDAPTESGTERDGILSYAGEWHSLGLGTGLMALAVLAGDPTLMAAAVAVSLSLALDKAIPGASRLRKRLPKVARKELKREPWYALGGNALGAVLGSVARLALDAGLPGVIA